MSNDFGLSIQQRIKALGVKEVFTPSKPIRSVEFFFGRKREVEKMLDAVNTPGQHALLFGDRGVGKSSLARVSCELLLQHLAGGQLFDHICSSDDSFGRILAKPLRAAGIDVELSESKKSRLHEIGGEVAGNAILAKGKASVRTGRAFESTAVPAHSLAMSPAWAADRLANSAGIFLIDELDAVESAVDRKKIAEFMKLLSDRDSKLKVVAVGIAATSADLVGGHPSVQRCVKEIELRRMSDPELQGILHGAERKLKLTISADVKQQIVRLSAGFPHFVHLLGLKCVEAMIRRSTSSTQVLLDDLRKAMQSSIEDASESLRRMYSNAIRSANTDQYRRVLIAAASLPTIEFNARDLREAFEQIFGDAMTQGSLNNYLVRLVSDDESAIMKRVAKGVYRFNDPRMAPFVRIANQEQFLT